MPCELLVPTLPITRRLGELQTEARRLAGELDDLAQRARAYHQIYRDSGGNHVFPLIAAHGALWAGQHFAGGRQLAGWLNWTAPFSRKRRAARIEQLGRLIDAFREINQAVCIETWVNFRLTREFGDHPDITKFISQELLSALQLVHRAADEGRSLMDAEKREVFSAHFLNEQATVVTPRITAALKEFDWLLMKALALRPVVKFAYLQPEQWIGFRDFSNVEERVRNGLRAFDAAAERGWWLVEKSLTLRR